MIWGKGEDLKRGQIKYYHILDQPLTNVVIRFFLWSNKVAFKLYVNIFAIFYILNYIYFNFETSDLFSVREYVQDSGRILLV